MKIKRSKSDVIVDTVIAVILILVAFVCLYPIWYTLIASFSDPRAISAGKVILTPVNFTFDGYRALLSYPELLTGYRNTLLYMFFGTFGMLAVTLPVGYAISKKKLPGRLGINSIFILSMYFAGGLMPTYLLHSSLGWINTPWVMLFPTFMNVHNMVLARSAFDSMPSELYEAATMDGCNDFRYFLTFCIPLCKATIAVLFLYGALSWWNEYQRFVIYVRNSDYQTIQVFIQNVQKNIASTLTEDSTSEEEYIVNRQMMLLRYSSIVCISLPFIIIYPFVQRYFNQGVMLGAIKG